MASSSNLEIEINAELRARYQALKASHARLVKALEKIAEANCTDEVLNPSMTMFMTSQVATIALAEAKALTGEAG